MQEIFAIGFYFVVLFAFAQLRKKRGLTQSDFVIGGRSLGRWTTALAAHASDMSNWLFMAYPGAVFVMGGQHVWVAIGLVTVMWLNWTFVAPRIRRESERSGSVTLCGFFENRLGQSWAAGRLVTAIALFVFYTVYVGAILMGVGVLMMTLFPLSYFWGVMIGILLVLPFLLMGGYLTLAQVDLFQGLFLLAVIIFVPVYVIMGFDGSVTEAVSKAGRSFSLGGNIGNSLLLMLGWGLGYLGQPHILTKFMGIRNPDEMSSSKWIGMSWQVLSLGAATLVGFVGIAVLGNLDDPEMVFIVLVRRYFSPVVSGIFLSGILAAVINTISSILLVLSTTIVEDVYKRFLKSDLSEKKQLRITRVACVISAVIALGIAMPNFASINTLVEYAWYGLGATFGPLVIACLYFRRLTKMGAWLGMSCGALIGMVWPVFDTQIPSLVVAFPISLGVIYAVSRLIEVKEEKLV